MAGCVTFLYELCELLSGRIFASDLGFELGREEIGYEMDGLAIHIGILENLGFMIKNFLPLSVWLVFSLKSSSVLIEIKFWTI